MACIAVTGGIACGKSLVGSILANKGVLVLDTDTVVHELIGSSGRLCADVISAFGEEFRGRDGGVNRQRLAERVFSNLDDLERLNSIIHPEVKRVWISWIAEQSGDHDCAVVIPLLYEIEEATGWDAVVCVACTAEHQIARLNKRGLSSKEACDRIAAQMETRLKAKYSDYVLTNNGSKDRLRKQIDYMLKCIREKQNGSRN